ncbi:YIP1 family protein [Allomuricauda sp. SCSIO 65647]|uniref:YIP1 family protein n=1 Tax=Allomuricauda sp. SCSIO 65647 TaxID=2908843 RepID=UPI001F343491|nr:YIP1 family protein [Muricauda sp. SCSIO 65647]UJH66490.1 YIP1 family protein [Muricauda sp. SCSIO 65647]
MIQLENSYFYVAYSTSGIFPAENCATKSKPGPLALILIMLQKLWTNPTKTFNDILSREIRWIEILPLFAVNGIYVVYYLIKAEKGYNLASNGKLWGAILGIIVIGSIWGIISNLFVGYLVKVTGRIFKAENNLKKIYAVFAWSSIPLIIACIIIILSLIFVRVILAQEETSSSNIFLSLLTIILNIGMIVPAIWSFILFYKGLKVAQKLDMTKTILNYILAIAIFAPLYYLIMFFEY